MLYYYIIIILIGLLSSLILFFKFPMLKLKTINKSQHKVSIIIPARNEEVNIKLLLQDLMQQNVSIHEIICVDDGSTDGTNKVASSFDIEVITLIEKPKDWTGKAWACQVGADAATGDIFLFLDADVRLKPNAVSSLINEYEKNKEVVSVQPYHKTYEYYEQFSFIFNIIQIAANGMTMNGKPRQAGLYGPVILIDKNTYIAIDGHLAASTSIVDDIALGGRLKKMGFAFNLFLGDQDISFRMYGNNFKSLYQGWTKNFATGASKAHPLVFLLVFLWVASCTASLVFLIKSLLSLNTMNILLAIVLYISWIFELFRISNKLGQFKKITVIAYQIYLVFFIIVFLISIFKRVLNIDVVWKDRRIELRNRL